MQKKYDAKVAEPKWQTYWGKEKVFAFDPRSKKPIYSIDTPPPTVSGKMHIGHAFSYTQQDFIARFFRLNGHNVFYPFGTDDNGLPTKLLVEKEKKVRASDMSRKEFVQLCLKTLEKELRPKYIADWKRIGMSCDFSLFYTTIDKRSQRISQKSFIDLYKDGREYRTEAPAMHCPKCQTAISQVECEDKEILSQFNDIIFKQKKGDDLIIATTRPDMLAACVAVFYHPDDKRYQSLNGKKTIVPLYEFSVPIMADKRVDPDKGSGLVMSCTFGDLTDCEWQKQYKLPIKEAIGKDGRMTKISGKYAGMPITKAREAIIEDLQEAKLLVNKKAIKRAVNVHERCGTPIEFIHSKQWFIKYLDLKKDLLKWGRELDWHPLHMKNRYDNWIKGLQWDWCISRQIPFGIPFPVWYCKECDEIILADEKTLPVDPTTDKPSVKACPKCKCKDFVPESDIINTWATSSLTPQIVQTLSSVNPKKLFPMSLRPQAHDIISFWLCNTVVKSQLHHKTNPWKDVAISGWALDPKGKKMSKSKGNIVEPQKIIEQYSADALRYWSASSKLGEDMPFQEKDIITGEKFSNKLWNASNFALSHLKTYNQKEKLLCGFDHWLLSKINTLITNATEQFTQYEYAQARLGVDMFFRQTFCDDYLEIVKDRVYNSDRRGVAEANSGRYTLYHSLLSCLKMIAPIMPHVTEEIYQAYYKKHEKNKSIHITDWPKELTVDKTYEKKGDRAIEIIHKVRKFKTDKQVSMKAPVILTLDQKDKTLLKDFIEDLKAVTSAQEVKFDNTLQIDLVD